MADSQQLEKIQRIRNKYKLHGKKFKDVLNAIYEEEPDRQSIRSAVMRHYPEKAAKSVFRGMAVPTTVNLKLARSSGKEGANLFLSPNGKLAVEYESQFKEILSRVIRDFLVFEHGIYQDTVDYFKSHAAEIKQEDSDAHKIFDRFLSQYVDFFGVELPESESDSQLKASYAGSGLEFATVTEKRRYWIRSVAPKRQLLSIEESRWKLMNWLLREEDTIVTTWMVDEALRIEHKKDDSIIELWEGTVQSETKLTSEDGRTYYSSMLVTE